MARIRDATAVPCQQVHLPAAMPAAGAAEVDKQGWEPWSGGLSDKQAAAPVPAGGQGQQMLTPASLQAEVRSCRRNEAATMKRCWHPVVWHV